MNMFLNGWSNVIYQFKSSSMFKIEIGILKWHEKTLLVSNILQKYVLLLLQK